MRRGRKKARAARSVSCEVGKKSRQPLLTRNEGAFRELVTSHRRGEMLGVAASTGKIPRQRSFRLPRRVSRQDALPSSSR